MAVLRNSKSKRALRHEPRVYPAIADVGIVLLDLFMQPVAFDRGAAEMFNEEAKRTATPSTPCGAGPTFSIPREIVDVIRRSKPGDPSAAKMRFRLGTRDYTCRSYLLEPATSPTMDRNLSLAVMTPTIGLPLRHTHLYGLCATGGDHRRTDFCIALWYTCAWALSRGFSSGYRGPRSSFRAIQTTSRGLRPQRWKGMERPPTGARSARSGSARFDRPRWSCYSGVAA